MKKLLLLRAAVLLWLCSIGSQVAALEPVSTGVAVTTALASSFLLASYDTLKCQFYECCDAGWVKPNITGLALSLQRRLHGQHLVVNTVIRAIKGHVKSHNPEKALVLSFHGWTGGGKNFVSRIIAEHLYALGMDSKYVHLFVSTLHFPHESQIETYKDQLREWIKGNVTQCGRTMFIFDEMDKMPDGLIDTVKPYIDHYKEINGVDYRKSIFIFLSNTGGNDITKKTLEHWQSGLPREELALKDMEEVINIGAFNEKGGLWHSSLIEKNLISAFIPFLPLERRHVKLCVRDDLEAKGHPVTEELLSKVADELLYFPQENKLFSKSGCKRVSQKVDLLIEDEKDTFVFQPGTGGQIPDTG